MRRAPASVLLALAFLLVVTAPAGAATGRPVPEVHTVEYATFTVGASDGLSAKVEASGKQITLTVGKGLQFTSYTVTGKLSRRGIEARFGNLGQVSVGFRSTRTVKVDQPAGGCGGDVRTMVEGVFSGAIRFRGEGGYVTVNAGRAKGEVKSSSPLKCSERRSKVPDPLAGFARLERESQGEQVAALEAEAEHRILVAIAVGESKARQAAFFVAGSVERRGPMRIVRATGAKAPLSAFSFDHDAGTATLTPPAPFTGSATFQRNTDGSSSWTGSLSVPVLGADPVILTGARFRTIMVAEFED